MVQAGSKLHVLGKCMDINGGGTADGTTVDLYDGNGTAAQVFIPQSNGSLYNPQSGRCLDDTGWSITPGTVWMTGRPANRGRLSREKTGKPPPMVITACTRSARRAHAAAAAHT